MYHGGADLPGLDLVFGAAGYAPPSDALGLWTRWWRLQRGASAGGRLLQVRAAPRVAARALGIRESIFKISHTNLRKKFQNLDLHPDSTRTALHQPRWVFVGGKQAEGSTEAAGRRRAATTRLATRCISARWGPGCRRGGHCLIFWP